MKLIPSRAITIHAARHAERWFPMMFRHADGSFLFYIVKTVSRVSRVNSRLLTDSPDHTKNIAMPQFPLCSRTAAKCSAIVAR